MKTEELIAYKGDVELEEARWDNTWGMTVRVKLEQRPHEMNAANPFKRFTKMRRGKVGTRFKAVFVEHDNEDETFYDEEVMLKGWSDGTSGWKLTLWIQPDDNGLHPFMDHERGQMYALVMVELDDEERPINQKKRERAQQAKDASKGGYRLSSYAAILCQNELFWKFLSETVHDTDVRSAEDAAQCMRDMLGIESRSELDHDDDLARTFHDKIRRPFADWNLDPKSHEVPF